MSDPEGEAPESGEEADSRPDLEPDEKADMDLSGIDLDAVDEATDTDPSQTAESGTESEPGDSPGDDLDGGDGELTPAEAAAGEAPAKYRLGDLYVELVVVLLVAAVDEFDEDADVDAEDVRDLANADPFPMSEAADDCLAEMLGRSDGAMTPQQALLASTAMVALTVLMSETDVLQDALGDALEGMEVPA